MWGQIYGKLVTLVFILLFTDNGAVYTWGDGSSGQLGHGPSILGLQIPQKIMKLSRRRCRDVECGESHTAVITGDVILQTASFVRQLLRHFGKKDRR